MCWVTFTCDGDQTGQDDCCCERFLVGTKPVSKEMSALDTTARRSRMDGDFDNAALPITEQLVRFGDLVEGERVRQQWSQL